jgi:hypothetical protein
MGFMEDHTCDKPYIAPNTVILFYNTGMLSSSGGVLRSIVQKNFFMDAITHQSMGYIITVTLGGKTFTVMGASSEVSTLLLE